MAKGDGQDARGRLLGALLDKISEDQYPSETMLDMVEELLQDDDVDRYVDVLLDKVTSETYPSVSMMRRLVTFAQPG